MVSGSLILRGGEVEDPLALALDFVEKYVRADEPSAAKPMSFDERDLRSANRGGARISALEMAEITRRISFGMGVPASERADHPVLDAIRTADFAPQRKLVQIAESQLGTVGSGNHYVNLMEDEDGHIWVGVHFGSRGFGHKTASGFLALAQGLPFGERATALVRGYKQDLDRNGVVLGELGQALANRGYHLTEVRLLDVLIWSWPGHKLL